MSNPVTPTYISLMPKEVHLEEARTSPNYENM
jgi:hypothetical protein